MLWFKHDIDAHDDIKIKKLLKKYGFSALGVYWFLIELLFSNSGSIKYQEAIDEISLVDGLSDEEAKKLVDYLISLELTYSDGFFIRSHRVDIELEHDENYRQMKSEAGRKGGLAKASKCQADAKQTLADAKQTLADSSREEKRREDKNIKKEEVPEGTYKKENATAAYEGVSSHEASPLYKERFNSIDGVIKCEKITVKREIAVSTILSHFTQDEISKVFEKLANSSFLKGDNKRGWKVTFDWLFDIDNFTNVLEGKYDKQKVEKQEERNLLNEYTPEQIAASKKEDEEDLLIWRRDHGFID